VITHRSTPGEQPADGGIFPATGTYTEVHTPKVLAFTWTWETGHPMAGVETNIRIELSAQGKDTFELMTHFGLPSARRCWRARRN